ncbi:MAG: patatin-like phospholipase family protein [Erythrobacter sp.]|nr:patatin-like phospholipase family protein [Erythrobacter sp.]
MDTQFDQLVFSGGGIRCFWHGGFLSVAGDRLGLNVQRVSGVSGGALSAAAWIGGRERDLLMLMQEAFRMNDANLDRNRSNYTPHEETYRAVVETTLDAEAIDKIAHGPDYQVSLSIAPALLSPGVAAVVYGVLYKLDQAVRSTPHLKLTKRSGLKVMRVDARQAAREGKLVDLICAAATIPPVFTVREWNGTRVLDGGMLDKAPLPSPDEGRTLVLLSSRYRNLPRDDRRVYVQPSSAVAADKIDFADSDKVKHTWEQGERDAQCWLVERGIAG